MGRSGVSTSNVHSENVERLVPLLPPSMLEAVTSLSHINARTERRPVPLLRRVSLELGDRSPDLLSDPPVPIDDPQLLATLTRVQREHEAARASALHRRRNITQEQSVSIASTQILPPFNLGNFQRCI